MKPIYVAGMYSANNVLDLLDNVRIGERAGTKLFLMGYAPFVPWFDRGFHGHLREGENLTLQEYYDYSIAWLRRSDELWVLPNSEKSRGTQKEIEIAEEMGIPIYDIIDIESMIYTKRQEVT